jgi:hypothetical protein
MSTTIAARMQRLGRPSVFVPIAIVAALILGAILLLLPRFGTPGAYEGGEAGPQANVPRQESIDGQGAEPDGIGGATDPGVFENAPTPLAEDSSANATSATGGDEMMDLGRDPPGGGRVNPAETGVTAGEIAEEDVPRSVRESEPRTALPPETGEGASEGSGAARSDTGQSDTGQSDTGGSDSGGSDSGTPDAADEAGPE